MNAAVDFPFDLDAGHKTSVAVWDDVPPALTWREKIAFVGSRIIASDWPKTDCPVEHSFAPGQYIRTMRIPSQTLFLGRAHLLGHECTLVEGAVLYITPTSRCLIHAPHTVHTQPGDHMVLFTLTDIVGRTVHSNPNDSRDIQALEDQAFERAEVLQALGHAVRERLDLLCYGT